MRTTTRLAALTILALTAVTGITGIGGAQAAPAQKEMARAKCEDRFGCKVCVVGKALILFDRAGIQAGATTYRSAKRKPLANQYIIRRAAELALENDRAGRARCEDARANRPLARHELDLNPDSYSMAGRAAMPAVEPAKKPAARAADSASRARSSTRDPSSAPVATAPAALAGSTSVAVEMEDDSDVQSVSLAWKRVAQTKSLIRKRLTDDGCDAGTISLSGHVQADKRDPADRLDNESGSGEGRHWFKVWGSASCSARSSYNGLVVMPWFWQNSQRIWIRWTN